MVFEKGISESKQIPPKSVMNLFHEKKPLKQEETQTSISEQEFNQNELNELKYEKKERLSACEEFKQNFSGFALMIWDGVGFFGTDHFKLYRLQGEKVNFCTPFKSIKSVILYVLVAVLSIYILFTEISRLGSQKSQIISFIRSDYYEYHYSNAIPLHSVNWFYTSDLIKHIRNH